MPVYEFAESGFKGNIFFRHRLIVVSSLVPQLF